MKEISKDKGDPVGLEKQSVVAEPTVYPEQQASWLSKLTYSWLGRFVKLAQSHKLVREDLLQVPDGLRSKAVGTRFIDIWTKERQKEDPRSPWGLHKTIFLHEKEVVILSGFLELVKMGAGLLTPLILQYFLRSYAQYQEDKANGVEGSITVQHLYVYCAAMCASQLLATFAGNWAIWIVVKSGINVRTGLMSAIYDRSLNLSGLEKKNYSIARATKMMSSDVLRIEVYWGYLHFFWTCPLQIILAFGFLYHLLDVSMLAGLAVIALSVPVQGLLIARMGRQRPKISETADRRIRLLQEILAGIRVIKLYSWDHIFRDRMAALRYDELKEVRKMRLLSALISTLTICLPVLASVATFMVRYMLDQPLSAEIVFPAMTYFGRMETPLIIIPIIASYTVDAREALSRIGRFLRCSGSTANSQERVESKESAVVVQGDFVWEQSRDDKNALQEPEEVFTFDLSVPKGSLVAIVGPVGSGKTTLLSVVNGELKRLQGNVCVDGRIGFCPQQAWIRNCTVRENIVFGQPFDEERYQAVIEQCALEADLQGFPHGDMTELGEKGISLSGGQKQRISLARMVYFNPDIAIMDDPLSAVDSQVGSTLFYDCILEGLLKDKTRILVTNQLHILPYVDSIVVLEDGKVTEKGSYEELLSKDTDFSDLLKKYAVEESTEDEKLSESESSESDDEHVQDKLMAKTAPGAASKPSGDERRDGVSWQVYWMYMSACGGLLFLGLATPFMFMMEGSRVVKSVLLRYWMSSAEGAEHLYYASCFGALALAQSFAAWFYIIMFVYGGYRAAKLIHERAFNRIIRSPVSFFDSTPVGRILNRFSKDLDILDSYVAEEFNNLILTFAVIISSLVLTVYVQREMSLLMVIPLVLGYLLQSTFKVAARQIQRLNAQNFSPLMSHFSETFSGLSSIRAFQVQEQFFRKHHELVDMANRAPLTNYALRRWVGIRSETMGSMLILLLSAACLVWGVPAIMVGMLISDTLNVNEYMDWCIKQFSDTENSMVAVERVNFYATKLETEAEEIVAANRPPAEWPQRGQISIQNLVVKYKASLPPVLKGISLEIGAGEHVAIVGRTGAGKTSIISALFRLVEPCGGSMTIDGIDITKIGLKDLRSRIAIVPQEPALFSGTLRFNLDPYGRYSDDAIWLALERTSMKEEALDLQDRLDAEVQEGGQNFSVGQRQLLCLTRALLLQSSIIVMDEATANIDLETDEQIQISLRENFKHSTLITIAHRINTIIDYDRIIVMDAGEVAECDTPRRLLADEDSIFHSLAYEAGVYLEDLEEADAAKADKHGVMDGLVFDDSKAEVIKSSRL